MVRFRHTKDTYTSNPKMTAKISRARNEEIQLRLFATHTTY